MITIACVLVNANVAYTPDYVRRLKRMCDRFCPVPFRFVCLTDDPFSGIDCIHIQHNASLPGWWAKLRLWDKSLGLSGPGIYLDLDSLVVSDLTPIIDFPNKLAFIPHAGSFEGKGGKRVIKCYNSSCVKLDFSSNNDLYSSWSAAVACELWGDQDWIASRLPNLPTFPLNWFPRLSEVKGPTWPDEAKVILCKKPKNHIAAKVWPWFDRQWGGNYNGRSRLR